MAAACAGDASSAEIPVFVFAGQSNAVAITDAADLTPEQRAVQSNVLYYGPGQEGTTWAPLQPPTEIIQVPNGFGPEISAARLIASSNPFDLVGVVKLAQGTTSLHSDWNPAHRDLLYDALIERIDQSLTDLETQTGMTGRVAGFFWMQGELDAHESEEVASGYGDRLREFITALRTNEIIDHPHLPFVFGRISDFTTYAPIVRDHQVRVAGAVPWTQLVLTDDLPHSDGIHLSSQGIYSLGERFAEGYLAAVPEPSLVTLTLSGALVVAVLRARSNSRAAGK